MTDNLLQNSSCPGVNRRDFFSHFGTGLKGIALASLLSPDLRAAESKPPKKNFEDLKPRPPHFRGRAKAVIQLFMNGGPSQVDLFDPKPTLTRLDGTASPARIAEELTFPKAAGGLLASPFEFSKHGKCGMDISNALPHLHKHADEIALIRSMVGEHFNHEQSLYLIHNGRIVPGRPSLGAWAVYALGSVNQNLPAYVVLDDPTALPVNRTQSWHSGFLSPVFQGTRLRAKGSPILNLSPPQGIPGGVREAEMALLRKLDEKHTHARPLNPDLTARIASYELAARMQLSATDALDLRQETERTRTMYGLDGTADQVSYGRRCLMARRLVERGVRYVQIFIEGQIWDSHMRLKPHLLNATRKTDQAISALLTDLRERGLSDEVLVIWNGEFGRMPTAQLPERGDLGRAGRDHGPSGFSLWMAGAGIKPGTIYGSTDDIGYRAEENPVTVHDFHATILHLLGLNHRNVFYTQPSHRRDRLTDEYPAKVVKGILS